MRLKTILCGLIFGISFLHPTVATAQGMEIVSGQGEITGFDSLPHSQRYTFVFV